MVQHFELGIPRAEGAWPSIEDERGPEVRSSERSSSDMA